MANDTIETLVFPKIPDQINVTNFDDLNSLLTDFHRYNRGVAAYNDDLYNILHSGYLIREFQVESLSADKLTAGTIAVDQVYLFDDKFELNGAVQQLIVKDNQATPKQRVQIGKFGAGSDYGIKIYDSSGAIVFQATSTVLMNGAIITNATISDSKINDLNGNKLFDNSVGNSKILSLSASKITVTGTLTCSSSGTAINVTSSGVVLFSGGGDIEMRATASNSNFITFKNSLSQQKGQIGYNPASDRMSFLSNADLYMGTGAGDGIFYGSYAEFSSISQDCVLLQTNQNSYLALFANGVNVMEAGARLSYLTSDWLPTTTNTYDNGGPSNKWANVWTVVQHTGDILFPNGFCLTEADKVYEGLPGETGQFLLGPDKKPKFFFGNDGNLYIKGHVVLNVDFDAMFSQYAPIGFEERHTSLKQDKLDKRNMKGMQVGRRRQLN